MAEGDGNMGGGEVLLGMLDHCFRYSHVHGSIWAINVSSLMLTLEMPAVITVVKKMTLDMSGATGSVIL